MDITKLKAQLTCEEASRPFPYDDATGLPPVLKGKLTVGIGYNLTDNGLPPNITDQLFALSVARVTGALDARLPWWVSLDDVRQRALADLCFNLGIGSLLAFSVFLHYLQVGDYAQAGTALAASLWFTQVGRRGPWICAMIAAGTEHPGVDCPPPHGVG